MGVKASKKVIVKEIGWKKCFGKESLTPPYRCGGKNIHKCGERLKKGHKKFRRIDFLGMNLTTSLMKVQNF